MKVTMFVKNSFEYDARVTREARALIGEGHEVTVVAIHVPEVTAREEHRQDGIHVVRVPRLSLGMGAINRIAMRFADRIETRNSALTGDDYDSRRVRLAGTVHRASTATPGDAPDSPQMPAEVPPAAASPVRRAWGRITTPLLRVVIGGAHVAYRVLAAVLGRQGRALKTWAINRRMVRVGISTRADVFHSHDLNTLYVGSRCKKRTGSALVYDSHELATERNRMGRWWRRWAVWNEKRWIRWADAIIVASAAWAPILLSRYPGIPEPITLLNVPEAPPGSPRDLRPLVGLDPAVPLLLYQGSIQENRGIEPAIEAVELLDGVALVVLGYGHHRPVLESLVAERGLEDRVRFFGPIPHDELLEYTASADIGLCNIVNSSLSYYTSMPNKLFEYFMAGIPAIGSDSPEIGQVIRETGAGEVCDPLDPHAIAVAAKTILADPERYRNAARQAAQRYVWSNESTGLIALYRGIAGQR